MLKLAICGIIFFIIGASFASASSLGVSPVRATLTANQIVESFIVRNDSEKSTVVQLEAVSWSQLEGADVYNPTNDILATPPIFSIPPKSSQVVRVGLRRTPDAQRQLAYRLFFQEVPPPLTLGSQGLQIALRIGVPVFVMPSVTAKPLLRWQASHLSEDQLKVSLTNYGNAHIQVVNFKLKQGDEKSFATNQAPTYLLPGQSRDWVVQADPSPVPGAKLRLSAQTDAGDMQANVVVEHSLSTQVQ